MFLALYLRFTVKVPDWVPFWLKEKLSCDWLLAVRTVRTFSCQNRERTGTLTVCLCYRKMLEQGKKFESTYMPVRTVTSEVFFYFPQLRICKEFIEQIANHPWLGHATDILILLGREFQKN